MLTKFWESIGTKLAEYWLARVLTPAFAFWAGGLVAWVWHRAGTQHQSWTTSLAGSAAGLRSLPVVTQGAIVIAILLGLTTSGLIAERLAQPVLRLLEGYWPGGRPRWLRVWLVRRFVARRSRAEAEFSSLYGKRARRGLTPREHAELEHLRTRAQQPQSATPIRRRGMRVWLPIRRAVRPGPKPHPQSGWEDGPRVEAVHAARIRELEAKQRDLTSEEASRLATLELRLRRLPVSPVIMMPTRLGNRLRAGEERPGKKYGLDAVAVWPQLWLILPKEAKEELTQVRAALDAAARLWLWGVLFGSWTVLAWWALPVAAVVATTTYFGSLLGAAEVYGDLLTAAFDVHRGQLYEAARWRQPSGPDDEPAAGAALTEYLWRGTAPAGLTFRAAEK